jgi:hypothetical protein
MRVEYGPPGHRGVSTIMGLGEVPAKLKALPLPKTKPLKTAGSIAIAAWLVGLVSGSSYLQHLGIGAGMAVLATQHFTNREELAGPVIEVVDQIPTVLNGWG